MVTAATSTLDGNVANLGPMRFRRRTLDDRIFAGANLSHCGHTRPALRQSAIGAAPFGSANGVTPRCPVDDHWGGGGREMLTHAATIAVLELDVAKRVYVAKHVYNVSASSHPYGAACCAGAAAARRLAPTKIPRAGNLDFFNTPPDRVCSPHEARSPRRGDSRRSCSCSGHETGNHKQLGSNRGLAGWRAFSGGISSPNSSPISRRAFPTVPAGWPYITKLT